MGYLGYFYVESKSYELRSVGGNGLVRLTEWGKGQIRSVELGFTRLVWLHKVMEELVPGTVELGACRSHRVGESVIVFQKRGSKYGKFMKITEFGCGRTHSYIVLPEGRDSCGWRHCLPQIDRLIKYVGKQEASKKKVNPTPVKTQPLVGGKSFVEVVMNKGKDIEPVRTVEEKDSPAKPAITVSLSRR
jgi:hypothetical protein